MVEKDSFPGITQLAGPTPFSAALKIKKMAVVAFYLAWDPVSNALLQHLSAVATKLEEHNSQASLYSINCFDWPQLCDGHGINTYPILRLYPHGRRNVTYSNAINFYHILSAILLVERPSPVELTSVRAVEDMLALKRDIHPAAQLTNAAVVGVFPTERDSSTFHEICRMMEGSQLLGLHISQEAVSTYCSTEAGCVVVSKPRDVFQPWRTLEAPLLRSTAIISVLSQATLNVMDQLDPERYSAMYIGAESSEEAPNSQHLIIVFLPSHTLQSLQTPSLSNTVPPWSYSSTASRKLPQDHLLITVGLLAADLSAPGFVFSWLTWNDPLAQQLGPAYGLALEKHAVVGVSTGKGEVHIFPQGNSTRASLKTWLTDLREGHSAPSVVLPKKVWEPRLPGFDFLRFMQEDQDHDAEDHLVLEMEADLTAKPHHGMPGKQKV